MFVQTSRSRLALFLKVWKIDAVARGNLPAGSPKENRKGPKTFACKMAKERPLLAHYVTGPLLPNARAKYCPA
jgi:hypothetical protein